MGGLRHFDDIRNSARLHIGTARFKRYRAAHPEDSRELDTAWEAKPGQFCEITRISDVSESDQKDEKSNKSGEMVVLLYKFFMIFSHFFVFFYSKNPKNPKFIFYFPCFFVLPQRRTSYKISAGGPLDNCGFLGLESGSTLCLAIICGIPPL